MTFPKVERLNAVADYLDTVPPERFDMGDWDRNWDRALYPECGFAGCAIGHAAAARIVPGLRLQHAEPVYVDPEYQAKAYWGWSSVYKAFEIRPEVAHHLFDADAYRGIVPTPAVVADRIRTYTRTLEFTP